jgi:hypothetical protein
MHYSPPPPPDTKLKVSKYNLGYIYKIIAFLAILSYNISTINAQPYMQDPYLPDCPSDVWIPAMNQPANTVIVTLCNGAYQLEVRFRYRIACGTWYDYYIEGVGEAGSSNTLQSVLGSSCYNDDMDAFMRDVSECLLFLNPAGFPPNTNGTCETNWRIMKGSCWATGFFFGFDGSPSPDPENPNQGNYRNWGYRSFAFPCYPDASNNCCLEGYTVCLDAQGNRYISQTNYQPPVDPTCNSRPEYECQPVCGSIYR